MFVKTGDKVRVIAGKDKGKEGTITKTVAGKDRVVVEGVNIVKSIKNLLTNTHRWCYRYRSTNTRIKRAPLDPSSK